MDKSCPVPFFEDIKRPDLCEKVNANSPWVYYSMEIAVEGLRFAGGLGILAGDILLQCEKEGIPFYGVTLYYPVCQTQTFEGSFTPRDLSLCIFDPQAIGFEKCDSVVVFANNDEVKLDVYRKHKGSSHIVALYEAGLGEPYQGAKNSDHRLYQEVVLGFAGHSALKRMGINPSILHLNEAATVFAALAHLDDVCKESDDLFEAMKVVRQKTLYTNHTLVQAAEAIFTRNQIERYVYKNLRSGKVKTWLDILLSHEKDQLNLSTLAIALSGNINAVSKLHARIATGQFYSSDRALVDFYPITNGINLERWAMPELLQLCRENGVLEKNDLPQKDYKKKIFELACEKIWEIKKNARVNLRKYLSEKRVDQKGIKINIPDDAVIVSWARRLVDYKRPKMIFDKPEKLAKIVEKHNIYILVSGKSHPGDEVMRAEIKQILSTAQDAPVLEKRVHYIQDYDDELAFKLITGSDIWLNTPIVGMEACGTSIWKAILNLTILISTIDGGAADINPPAYIPIKGEFVREEVDSLHDNLEAAAKILAERESWSEFVKHQLSAYLPIISGARMVKDYLNFVFSKNRYNF